jgi:hypothetical protein
VYEQIRDLIKFLLFFSIWCRAKNFHLGSFNQKPIAYY